MSSKQTVLDREMFVQALRHMGQEDLLFLNRMVVERLNLLAQATRVRQLIPDFATFAPSPSI